MGTVANDGLYCSKHGGTSCPDLPTTLPAYADNLKNDRLGEPADQPGLGLSDLIDETILSDLGNNERGGPSRSPDTLAPLGRSLALDRRRLGGAERTSVGVLMLAVRAHIL